MRYKSCHLIEHGISLDVDSIKACCLSREFNKGQLMIIPYYDNNKINWKELFEIKRQQRQLQKQKDLPACEGCYNLREDDWDDEDYISYINFDHWSQCNSNCVYCGVSRLKPKTKNNILKPIKELINLGKFKNTGEITFQGGEPTILKEFDDLLKLFIKQQIKIRIHSSGIKYSNIIKEGLKKGNITIVISRDSAYKETYKMNVNVTNCSNNYGPYQHNEKLIPHMIKLALNDEKLPVYGTGKNIRDWLYVEDHCEAIDLVFHKGIAGERYNIGGHNEKRNIEIVKLILQRLGK